MKTVNAYCPVERPFDVSTVPIVRGDAIRMLWVDDFWDLPRSGVCEYQGRRHWFQNYYDLWYYNDEVLDNTAIDDRLLALVERDPPLQSLLIHELSAAQMAEEEKWHQLFIKCVGGHFDYTGEHDSEVKPSSDHAQFYEPYNKEAPTLDLAETTVVAVWLRG